MERAEAQLLTETFSTLFVELEGTLSASEKREISDFVDVGEFGVALEALSALLVEEAKAPPGQAFTMICQLADRMGIRRSVVTDSLEQLARGRG